MGDAVAGGDVGHHLSYLEILKMTIRSLRDEITNQRSIYKSCLMRSDAQLEDQEATLRSLKRHKKDLIHKLDNLSLKESEEAGYYNKLTPYSLEKFKDLQDQVKDLDQDRIRLHIQLADKRQNFFDLRRQIPLVELCNRKYRETLTKMHHKENAITDLFRTFAQMRNSCKELHFLIDAVIEAKYSFHKHHKTVRRLVVESMDSLPEDGHVDYLNDNNGKLPLLYENTSFDSNRIIETLSEMRKIIQNHTTVKDRPSCPIPTIINVYSEPFLPDFSNLNYSEKRARCDIILTRIRNTSEEEDLLSMCRKYWQNEHTNRLIFKSIQKIFIDTDQVFNVNNGIRDELTRVQKMKNEALEITRSPELEKLVEICRNVRKEAARVEELVDSKYVELNNTAKMLLKMLEMCWWKSPKTDLLGSDLDEHFANCLRILEKRVMELIKCLFNTCKQPMKSRKR